MHPRKRTLSFQKISSYLNIDAIFIVLTGMDGY